MSPLAPPTSRPAPRAALRWIAPALSLALSLAACAPRTESDCDQLLADQDYAGAVKSCEDPSALSMAYLGLAGFDFIALLASDDPGNIAALLELDASNVSVKRELINQAIREVYPPDSTKQAFLLLLASFLGLSVTNSEYLDNGAGGATAFDNRISGGEVESATGLVVLDPAPPVPFSLDPSATYAMLESNNAYVVNCGADALPPLCDDNPGGSLTITDDTSPLKGAGLDVTTAAALLAVTAATKANQIVMLLSLDLPISVDNAKLERLESFLGEGTLDPDFPIENPDLFPIGVLGYLNAIDLANLELIEGAGGDIEQGEPAESTLNDTVDALRAKLDNGAACFKGGATDPVKTAAAIPLNILYAIYRAAPGTQLTPVPTPQNYKAHNVVAHDDLDSDGDNITDDAGTFLVPDGSLFEFGGGALSMGYKVLYPNVESLAAFDRSQATPRIDQTPSQFRTNFELLPRLSPNAAEALDGSVEMIEVICAADNA